MGSEMCIRDRDQTSMVWLTAIQHLHVLAVQHSLTVVRPSQAFHDSMCDYRVMFAIFSTVAANGTCTETGRRQGVNGTRRRQAPTVVWLFPIDQYKPLKVREKHYSSYISVWVDVSLKFQMENR